MDIKQTWDLREPIAKLFSYDRKITFYQYDGRDLCILKTWFSNMDILLIQNFLKGYDNILWNISVEKGLVEIHFFKVDEL